MFLSSMAVYEKRMLSTIQTFMRKKVYLLRKALCSFQYDFSQHLASSWNFWYLFHIVLGIIWLQTVCFQECNKCYLAILSWVLDYFSVFDMRIKKWLISNVLCQKSFGRKYVIPFRLSYVIEFFTLQKCYTAARGRPAFLPHQTSFSQNLNKNRTVYM